MYGMMMRILLPVNSRRGSKARELFARSKNYRENRFKRNRYNVARQKYYKDLIATPVSNATKKISIVVPCFNTPQKYLEPLLASVFAQGYPNWELVLVDASTEEVSSRYIQGKCDSDVRIIYIKTENRGIAANTNVGINAASGDYISFMDHDDTLDPNALAEVANLFHERPEYKVIYSDEDKVTDDGSEFFSPHFKPGFSLDMLRNVNYINHFTTIEASFLRKLGGIREGFEGAQDYDLLLRAVDAGAKFGHIPKVLYHWREAENSTASDFSNKQYVTKSGCMALQEHFERSGLKNVTAKVIPNRPGFYIHEYKLNKRKRIIHINLEKYSLTELEKNVIYDHYRHNKSVIKHDILVSTGGKSPNANKETTICTVNGLFIPASKEHDITALFGIAEESGVSGVSPCIVRHGKIYDMGILRTGVNQSYLFRGVDPLKSQPFGSTEWVRNVDALSDNVVVASNGGDTSGRNIIWTHVEFVGMQFDSMHHKYDPEALSNRNIVENVEYLEDIDDNLASQIRVRG